MKFTLTKIAAGLGMVAAAASAHAAPVALTGTPSLDGLSGQGFSMYNGSGVLQDANSGGVGKIANITGTIDTAAGTWAVSSTSQYAFKAWTASGGTLYNPGTYTVNVNGDGASGAGAGDVTFTVGAGQLGGNINFAWGTNSGIDVFNVWDVASNTVNVSDTISGGFRTVIDNVTTTYTSSNMNAVAGSVLYNGVAVNADTWPGLPMVDGPFINFSANFDFTTVTTVTTVTPVHEASTYGMMLAGLGLVGFAVRRRKFMA
jgi:hypothetical protein